MLKTYIFSENKLKYLRGKWWIRDSGDLGAILSLQSAKIAWIPIDKVGEKRVTFLSYLQDKYSIAELSFSYYRNILPNDNS